MYPGVQSQSQKCIITSVKLEYRQDYHQHNQYQHTSTSASQVQGVVTSASASTGRHDTSITTTQCRLCLYRGQDLVTTLADQHLAGRIRACLSVQINEDDGLPTNICKRCERNVNNWCVFKEICDNVQVKLQDWIKSSRNIAIRCEQYSEEANNHTIDASAYPGVEVCENGELKLQNEGPSILASLGLAPKGDNKENASSEHEECNESSQQTSSEKLTGLKKRPIVAQLASKDCLVCGRAYRYSHNARRHELAAHGYDRYTNKIKPNNGVTTAKTESHKPSPNVAFQNNQLQQRKEITKFSNANISSAADYRHASQREPEILKSLLTSQGAHSEMDSISEESEDEMSDPEYPVMHVETVITEPDVCDNDSNVSEDESEKHYQSASAKEDESDCEEVEISNMDINEIIGVQAHDAERIREEYAAKNAAREEVAATHDQKEYDEYVKEDAVQGSDDFEPSELVIEEQPEMTDDEEYENSPPIAPVVEINEHPLMSMLADAADVVEESEAMEEMNYVMQEQKRLPVVITSAQRDFMVKYRDIIEQVNTMRCNCCNKDYPKRKAVVSHLQKVGFRVPRFTCYNCVITYSHIGALLSHMRANCCTDLWKLIYEEGGIPDSMVVETGEGLEMAQNVEDSVTKTQYKDILNARSYSCKLCPAKFQLKQFIMKHVMDVHESGGQKIPLLCIHCKCKFKDSKIWKKHTRNGECMVHISCDICSEKFSNLTDFNRHALTVHVGDQANENLSKQVDGRPTNCPICGKTTTTYHNLVKHLKIVHNEDKPHMCQHCDSKFSMVSELNHHMYTQHSEKLLQNGHQETAVKKEYNNSSAVKKEYNYSPAVKQEYNYSPAAKEEYNYSCTECSSVFETMEDWTQHQITVHEHIAYECDECEMKFLQDSQLIDHKNRHHSKIKLHQCPHCPFSYSSNQKLLEHVAKSHPGSSIEPSSSSPFYCDICVRSFKSRQAFSNHMRIHAKVPTHNRKSGEPKDPVKKTPFHSPNPLMPKMQGATIVNYNKKIQRNVPDAPYSCDICGKGFLHKKNIWKHKKILHPEVVKRSAELDNRPPPVEHFMTDAVEDDNYANGDAMHKLSIPQFDSFASAVYEQPEAFLSQQMYTEQDYQPEQKPSVTTQSSGSEHYQEEDLVDSSEGTPMYQCDMCDKKFAVRTSIWKHKKLKHGIINPSYQDESPEVISSKISCTICKISFSDKKAYYRHRKTVHRQNGQTCKICNKTFTSANSSYELYEHLKSAHAKELLGYNNSDENFNGSHNSSRHVSDEEQEVEEAYESEVSQVNSSSKYSCGVCGNDFPGMIALRTHKCPAANKVISQDTYNCEICHKSYTSISALKSHRGWHLRSPDGKAAFSNSGLWMPQNKVTHKVSKHEVLEQVVKKPAVPNSSLTINHLQLKKKLPPDVQLSIVKKKKPNEEVPMVSIPQNDQSVVSTSASKQVALTEGRFCEQCNREFTKKAAYFRHMEEVHRPNSVFCPICNKSFTRKSTLLVHMKKHETDSAADSSAPVEEYEDSDDDNMDESILYSCDLCNIQFPDAMLYKQHCVKMHDVSEDDIVDESPTSTIRPQDLASRQKCEQCGDHFRTDAEMWSHRHYTCETCGQHFSSPNKLSHHARKHRDQEKMFLPCNICDRYYMNEQSLQKHMEMSH